MRSGTAPCGLRYAVRRGGSAVGYCALSLRCGTALRDAGRRWIRQRHRALRGAHDVPRDGAQKRFRHQQLPGPPGRRTQCLHHQGRDRPARHRAEGGPRQGGRPAFRTGDGSHLPRLRDRDRTGRRPGRDHLLQGQPRRGRLRQVRGHAFRWASLGPAHPGHRCLRAAYQAGGPPPLRPDFLRPGAHGLHGRRGPGRKGDGKTRASAGGQVVRRDPRSSRG